MTASSKIGFEIFQTSFLLSMRNGVQNQQIDLTLAAASFVTGLMKYYKQVIWVLHHFAY
jgi:hypothetical protein